MTKFAMSYKARISRPHHPWLNKEKPCYNIGKSTSVAVMDRDKYDTYLDAAKKEIGQKIKEARIAQRLAQHEVAQLAGVSQPVINYIENGKKWSRLDLYGKVCNALGLKASELLASLDEVESLTAQEMLSLQELRRSFIRVRSTRDQLKGKKKKDDQ